MRKIMPVARRVLGASDELTLRMGGLYATALYLDAGATLDDIREGRDDAPRTLDGLRAAGVRVARTAHRKV